MDRKPFSRAALWSDQSLMLETHIQGFGLNCFRSLCGKCPVTGDWPFEVLTSLFSRDLQDLCLSKCGKGISWPVLIWKQQSFSFSRQWSTNSRGLLQSHFWSNGRSCWLHSYKLLYVLTFQGWSHRGAHGTAEPVVKQDHLLQTCIITDTATK